jgi:hypothetical protein
MELITRTIVLAVACVVLLLTGCQPTQYVRLPAPPREIPPANLPLELRQTNWLGSKREGSCVHASTMYVLRWNGQYELADAWRQKFGNGETGSGIMRKLTEAGVPFYATANGDPRVLEYASETRRACIIWFFTSHCVTFCGFSKDPYGKEYAYLCDNNRVQQFIKIEKEVFIKRWQTQYDGFACCFLGTPLPPPLYPAIAEVES